MKKQLFYKLPCTLVILFALLIGACGSSNSSSSSSNENPGTLGGGVTIYGSQGIMSFSDFTDVAGYESYRDAINWYLSSGVTNGGQTFTTFGPGDILEKWEPVHAIYRFYCIMNESGVPFADTLLFPGGLNIFLLLFP